MICPNCGEIPPEEHPLHGAGECFHCPFDGCDRVLSPSPPLEDMPGFWGPLAVREAWITPVGRKHNSTIYYRSEPRVGPRANSYETVTDGPYGRWVESQVKRLAKGDMSFVCQEVLAFLKRRAYSTVTRLVLELGPPANAALVERGLRRLTKQGLVFKIQGENGGARYRAFRPREQAK